MRNTMDFQISQMDEFLTKLVYWGSQFDEFVLLNSNAGKTHESLYSKFQLIAGVGSIYSFIESEQNIMYEVENFIQSHNDWILGYMSYDLKNNIERKLESNHFDGIGFSLIHFFVPKLLLRIESDNLSVEFHNNISPDEIRKTVNEIKQFSIDDKFKNQAVIEARYSTHEYLNCVKEIKNHILRGDIYEMNLCQEFYSNKALINPALTYLKLNQVSPAPFSSYLKHRDKYLLCSSMERFLAKRGNKIISQPIKGTINRGKTEQEDNLLRDKLANHPKEIAENIMITDLVRNDLSVTALKGSVKVEELCGVYTFAHVHQMISTIVSEFESNKFGIADLFKSCFPMGSMTGAPKIKAMELIERYEKTRRGLYSGCVGYITPKKDFDFNVVIRSILYNAISKYLSIIVGSAITYQSDPQKELEECFLKAQAMQKALRPQL